MIAPRFVLDASAIVEFLGAKDADDALIHRVLMGRPLAPEIVDLEVTNAVRKQVRRGLLTASAADKVIDELRDLPVVRSPHRALIPRVWELRHAIATYDAAYVALAEQLGIPLVTTDAKLARSHGHKADIELYAA